MTTDKDGRSLRAGLSSLRDEAAQEASSPKASIPIATNSVQLFDLARAMVDAIIRHRATRGQSTVGRDGRTRYGSRELIADIEIDEAARAFCVVADIEFPEKPSPRFATDRDAMRYLAQGIEARRAETAPAGSVVDESPVATIGSDAPQESAP